MNDVAAKWPVSGWEMQIWGEAMKDERDQMEAYANAVAEKKFLRLEMKRLVRNALNDAELVSALRAQSWLSTGEQGVTELDEHGKLVIKRDGYPLGHGEPVAAMKAYLAERLFPNEKDRADAAWMFEDGDDG